MRDDGITAVRLALQLFLVTVSRLALFAATRFVFFFSRVSKEIWYRLVYIPLYTGVVKYGDRVWLQSGRHEVLATSALYRDTVKSWDAVLGEMADASKPRPASAPAAAASRTGAPSPPKKPDWAAHAPAHTTDERAPTENSARVW